ncbi:AzlD family protein [Natrinema altunense]|uniref:Branched-chain amino acid transport n=1 Tax=Natrinema altunense (strain JCM 12890 / CGMCC 1.3731 / AJ2) TaxID=1227494 RepID=M0A3W6_NATA2|nr:AzlD domain-containing protein [Natrinema altunense]ELY92023.1 branched-chain amino acid transport [Natrinema altunense JCM 12890]
MGSLHLDPFVVAVIVGMSAATYVTKAGGLWLLGRINISDRTEAGLEMLPGAIIISILGPELTSGGPAEWGAAAVVLLVMWRSENVLVALLCGVAAVLLFRSFI